MQCRPLLVIARGLRLLGQFGWAQTNYFKLKAVFFLHLIPHEIYIQLKNKVRTEWNKWDIVKQCVCPCVTQFVLSKWRITATSTSTRAVYLVNMIYWFVWVRDRRANCRIFVQCREQQSRGASEQRGDAHGGDVVSRRCPAHHSVHSPDLYRLWPQLTHCNHQVNKYIWIIFNR
jgi:hypothetical protein